MDKIATEAVRHDQPGVVRRAAAPGAPLCYKTPMRCLVLLLCFLAAALPAQGKELRVPKDGKYALLVDLPRGWQTRTDKLGGMLVIPPAARQHAMLYLGIVHDAGLRGATDAAVAAKVGRMVGVTGFDKQEPAHITDRRGAMHRGTMFYAKVPERRGYSRQAKIVIVQLAPDTWAQAWVVIQAGMNYVEADALDKVLNGIRLATE